MTDITGTNLGGVVFPLALIIGSSVPMNNQLAASGHQMVIIFESGTFFMFKGN